MPAGDAGRPYGTPAEENAWDVANELRAEIDRLQAQLAAQQAVVEAQRAALVDIAEAASNTTPKTAMWYMARTAREALPPQAAQTEGERG